MTDTTNEELAFDAQIKRLYAVLYSLGIDPKDFKKNQNITSYAKLTRRQVSDWITELEQQEKENKEKKEAAPHNPEDKEGIEGVMRESIKEAVNIVETEIGTEEMTTDTRADVISKIGITMFIKTRGH